MSPEEAEMAEAEELLRAAEEKGGRPWPRGWLQVHDWSEPGSLGVCIIKIWGFPTSSKSLVFFERDHGWP